jgi:hypothetical protein
MPCCRTDETLCAEMGGCVDSMRDTPPNPCPVRLTDPHATDHCCFNNDPQHTVDTCSLPIYLCEVAKPWLPCALCSGQGFITEPTDKCSCCEFFGYCHNCHK